MNLLRQPEAVARQAGPQLLHSAWLARHGARRAGWLGQVLLDVPAARQELPDPDDEARDEDSGAGDKKGHAEGHAGGDQSEAEGQHEGCGRRTRHLDIVDFGLRIADFWLALAVTHKDSSFFRSAIHNPQSTILHRPTR